MRQNTSLYWINLKTQPRAVSNKNEPSRLPETLAALKLEAIRHEDIAIEEAKNAAEDAGFLNEGESTVPDLPMTDDELKDAVADIIETIGLGENPGLQEGQGQPPYYA